MKCYKSLSLLFIFTLISVIGFTSCDVGGSHSSTGTLNIRLSDAPANYEAVYLDIQRVELNKDEDSTKSDWKTISNQPVRVDLLKLNNGADSLLASVDVEARTYHQIRFILGDNNEVIVNGESHSLTVSSGQESGYKLNVNATVQEDMTTTKILDFDASRSISVTGNGEYMLNPVVKVFAPEETGTLSGQLVPPGTPALITAKIGNEIEATTYAEANGTFKLTGLKPNVYKLMIQPATDQYADTTLFENTVVAEQDHSIGVIELSEN